MGVSRGWARNFLILRNFLNLIFDFQPTFYFFLILAISFVEIYNPPAMTKFRQKYYF